jgi:hypothetical protein
MRTLILTAIICLQGFYILAAQQEPVDKVILLNGDTHTGWVVEQKPGEYIKLLLFPGQDTLQFDMEEIDRIVKILPVQQSTQMTAPESDGVFKASKTFNSRKAYVMIHGVAGGGDYAFGGFGLSFGANLNNRTQVGISAHYLGQTSTNTTPERQTFPVAVDARYAFAQSKSGRFSSVAAISTGLNFAAKKVYFDEDSFELVNVGNGFYLNPSLGFKANIMENTGLMIDIGYQMHTASLVNRINREYLGARVWNTLMIRGSLFF